MDGLGIFLRRIEPRFDDLENEEAVFLHKLRIPQAAFEVGEALSHKGRGHPFGRDRRQPERGKLVDIAARRI